MKKESGFKSLLESAKFTPGPWAPLIPKEDYFPDVRIGPPLPWEETDPTPRIHKITVNEGRTPEDYQRGHGFGTTMETCDANVVLIAQAPAILAVLVEVDALFENLWKAVPWGSTFGLDIERLNKIPLAVKQVLFAALTVPAREEEEEENAAAEKTPQ